MAIALLLLSSCTAAPASPSLALSHRHRITTTLTVTEAAVLPSNDARIPVMSTLVWRNHTGQPLQIDIAAAACNDCDTVLGFTAAAAGARAIALAPGGVATLCFHDPGSFAYVTRTGSLVHDGTVHVEARP
jgi:hypothetical protein